MRTGEGEKEGEGRGGDQKELFTAFYKEGKRDRRDGGGTGEGESRRDGKGE